MTEIAQKLFEEKDLNERDEKNENLSQDNYFLQIQFTIEIIKKIKLFKPEDPLSYFLLLITLSQFINYFICYKLTIGLLEG